MYETLSLPAHVPKLSRGVMRATRVTPPVDVLSVLPGDLRAEWPSTSKPQGS